MAAALKGYADRHEEEFELAAWNAWMGARLSHTDPKKFPSFEKLIEKKKPLPKRQSDAELNANLRAWAMVLKKQ